ncbi:MAG TPA: SPOR domain-containing protein [Bacteroidia bacterium]
MKKLTFIISLLFVCLFTARGRSQNSADTGRIELVQEYKIKELLAKHVEVNSKSELKGYRVKIHFGSDKTKAREVKAKFISRFPEVPAYEKYDQPNFNIRVGDFRTKLEAYRFLKEVQAEFPSAFIVNDEIELPLIR